MSTAVASAAGKSPTRPFSNTGERVSTIGYGAMGLAAFYGKPKSQSECDAVFERLLQLGVTFWDTSDIYTSRPSLGQGEEQLGSWFKSAGKRDQVFLATKWGFALDGQGNRSQHGEYDYAISACEASLKRLNTDKIDLYYHHRPAPGQIEDSARAMRDLKQRGSIRYVGVSEYNLDQLKQFNDIVHIDAFQIELSPWTPQPLFNGLVDWCTANKTQIVPYSPLGRGFLTGKYQKPSDLFSEGDFRSANARYTEEAFAHNMKLVDQIRAIAAQKGANVTPGQISLAWLLAHGDNITPIPGSTQIANIEENANAAAIQLTRDEVASIDKLVQEFKTLGERYPASYQATLAF
ncbi:Aldo/keto reductase [Ceraceosorus guamensis]|uniref:Aldo/keto reductase n=1 Tax=Ceraceosorus guamensis TaxID=1522189 RepID=A0A316W824_9BASI|nr:Aldo/keto reductase [Ceraceosorus guamensis]PWN46029.1 Aldo/keto reductase [Ceraceosorus guamensis]